MVVIFDGRNDFMDYLGAMADMSGLL